jgi:hypothetical protein
MQMRDDTFIPPIWLRESGTAMMVRSIGSLAAAQLALEEFEGHRGGVWHHAKWVVERAIAGKITTDMAREAFHNFAESEGILGMDRAA